MDRPMDHMFTHDGGRGLQRKRDHSNLLVHFG